MKKLKVTAEIGFDEHDVNLESAKLDLRKGLKEVVFEVAQEYDDIVVFNISEIVLETDGSDIED